MKEARIECVIREFPVHDLGLRLKHGQVVFVAEPQAKASADLAEAQRIKAVRVRYVERAVMNRKPPPEAVRPPPPPNVRLPRQRPHSAPAAPGLSMDEFKAVAAEAARESSLQTSREIAELKAMLAAALSRPVQGTAAPAVEFKTPIIVTRAAPAPEPVFIPDQIVNKDATFSLGSESKEADGLDEAAAALKTSRRGRKKKESGDGG